LRRRRALTTVAESDLHLVDTDDDLERTDCWGRASPTPMEAQ
jgi:hypothetical protein